MRRWDWLTQLAAHVACALYWFNPLVWFAARQMRIERERACDDLVLASGASLAWALRKGTPQLRAEVDEFVRGHRVGTTFGNVVARRYFENNRWITNPASPEQRRRFDQVVGAFERAGAEFELDPLLLLAQGYQESGLDQRRRSSAGEAAQSRIANRAA